jgi:hypothetical protein
MTGARRVKYLLPALVCGVPLIAALALHAFLAVRSWNGSFATPDAPAHFTTGVMSYDYLRGALGSNPVTFAEAFYVRYPKVAIGHWPPVYYVLQALWYLFIAPSPNSARVLSAIIAAAMALLLWRRLRRTFCPGIAPAATAIFLILPGIQEAAWDVMSDLLTGLFVLLAVWAFSDFLERPEQSRSSWMFALWSSLAILTKGSAWAIGPFAVLAPLLAARYRCFRTRSYWISGAAIIILAAPFFVIVARMGIGYPLPAPGQFASAEASNRFLAVAGLPHSATIVVCALAAVGFVFAIMSRWSNEGNNTSETTHAIVCGAWVLAQLLFLFVSPLTFESRVFVPALAPMAILTTRCIRLIQESLSHRPALAPFVPAAIACLVLAACGFRPGSRLDGFRAASDAIPFRPRGSVILVSGDVIAEGDFIAERLARDLRRTEIVLRASNALASSMWNGIDYRLRFQSAGEVRQYLLDLPVHYVVVDRSGCSDPHNRLLAEALLSAPGEFTLLGIYGVAGTRMKRAGEFAVYWNRAAGDRRPTSIRLRIAGDLGGRTLEYQVR